MHAPSLNGEHAAKPAGWENLEGHPLQSAYYRSRARFNMVCAGRRSGKSVIARYRGVRRALTYSSASDGYGVLCAPTRDQVKKLHWQKMKNAVPSKYVARVNGRTPMISESELSITIAHNGFLIQCLGMDKPERAEGMAIDWALMDEIADMKPSAWALSVRPSLSTRGRIGTADMIGKPRGHNHFFDMWTRAVTLPGWRRFHWKSSSVLPRSEIIAARAELSELQFRQEYDADFVLFEGRAYYNFERELHATHTLSYDSSLPLELCFDFNRRPGTATVCQRQDRVHERYPGLPAIIKDTADVHIAEVWRERDSNTPKVCRDLANQWGWHCGLVFVYGDATGGSEHSSSTEGSDWDLVFRELRQGFPHARIVSRVQKSNPPERARVNTFNAALIDANDMVSVIFDSEAVPKLIRDMENVATKDDGSGRIDKAKDPMLTHPSDGVGYRLCVVSPIVDHVYVSEPLRV